ncbi:MAG: RNA polymerase sigma factor [Bacteroidetes bacterium]|nr:RNA polymerase sigma factor [Bacteroidota bacterium]
MNESAIFRELMEVYKDKVVNTCYGFLHSREDAEDVAQEVFLEVYLSYQRFRGESSIATWIYRIAVNKSLDVCRKRNTQKRIAFFKKLIHIDHINTKEIVQYEDDALTMMENRERTKVLYQALDLIPQNQRIAITLSKFEDLSMREISKVMDTSESAVESLLSRAKVSLKKQLENYYRNNENV